MLYQYKDIRVIHLEVTDKCNAACPMCARNFHGGATRPFIRNGDISIEQFKEWFPVTLIQHLDRVFMCGNLGDPIIAKDTLKIFQYLKEIKSTLIYKTTYLNAFSNKPSPFIVSRLKYSGSGSASNANTFSSRLRYCTKV